MGTVPHHKEVNMDKMDIAKRIVMVLALVAAILVSCGCTAEPAVSEKLDSGVVTFTENIIEEVILYENVITYWD